MKQTHQTLAQEVQNTRSKTTSIFMAEDQFSTSDAMPLDRYQSFEAVWVQNGQIVETWDFTDIDELLGQGEVFDHEWTIYAGSERENVTKRIARLMAENWAEKEVQYFEKDEPRIGEIPALILEHAEDYLDELVAEGQESVADWATAPDRAYYNAQVL